MALAMMGIGEALQGRFGRGLELCGQSLQLAQEMDDRQFQSLANFLLGSLYLDLHAVDLAMPHLQRAQGIASAMNSPFHARLIAALLARAYLLQGERELATATIDDSLGSGSSHLSSGERGLWAMRAEIALAHGEAVEALAIVERLLATAPNADAGPAAPHLSQLWAAAALRLGRVDEAEAALLGALEIARRQGAKLTCAELHRSLGRLYQTQKRLREADYHHTRAHELEEEVVADVETSSLRRHFLRRAAAASSRQPSASPARATAPAGGAEFGGLTRRECEVAALVSRGESNKTIALLLGLSERTVEKHVSGILSKLGFRSRTQVATWFIERGVPR